MVVTKGTDCRSRAAPRPDPQSKAILSRQQGNTQAIQNRQNRGNEAKKWLKTKDITFLSDADYVRFARTFAPIERQIDQKRRKLRRTKTRNPSKRASGQRQEVGYGRGAAKLPRAGRGCGDGPVGDQMPAPGRRKLWKNRPALSFRAKRGIYICLFSTR